MPFDIITRYSLAELPFSLAFHNHYSDRGANKIFYIVSDPVNCDSVANKLHCILSCAGHKNYRILQIAAEPNRALMRFELESLESEYFLSIDMDEYISELDLGQVMKDLIISSKTGYINIGWTISCSDFKTSTRKASFRSRISKVAAKTELVQRIAGPHSLRMKDGTLTSMKEKTSRLHLIHYWSRSFDDILLKCLFQRFRNLKYSGHEQLMKPKSFGLPNRLKLLSYMKRCTQTVSHPDFVSQFGDDRLAHRICIENLGDRPYLRLKRLYKRYKQSIPRDESTSLCLKLGPLALADWIQQQEQKS